MRTMNSLPSRITLILAILAAAAGWAMPRAARADDRLTNDANVSQLPRVACDGSYVHVVWQDNRLGKEEIYYKRYNGTKWSDTYRLSAWDNANSITPSIAACNGYVHVVWTDYGYGADTRIAYVRSTNNGDDWVSGTTPSRQLLPYTSYSCYSPSVASNNNNGVHVVYHNHCTGNYEVYYVRSSSNGASGSWSNAVNISNTTGDSQNAKITCQGCFDVFATWQETVDGAAEVYANATTSDDTYTWSGAKLVSGGSRTNSMGPEIANRFGRAAVVWYDYRSSNVQIYYSYTTNNGTKWQAEKAIGGGSGWGSSYFPSVAMARDNDKVQVVWQNAYYAGNYEIYRDKSMDLGVTWTYGLGGDRLTNNTGSSQRPNIAMSTDGSCAHVVWQDDRDGNWEIYYKRLSSGILGEEGEISINAGGGSPLQELTFDSPAAEEGNPLANELVAAQPNPFGAATTVRYSLAQASPVSVRIYGISGRLIRTLAEGEQAAGGHGAAWDGRDESGRPMETGVYFCTVGTADRRTSCKLMLVRH